MENKIDKVKLLQNANNALNELEKIKDIEEMIQDNMIEFGFEEEIYRVRKLTRRERHEIQRITSKEKYRLLNEKDNVTEEELIQTYLNRKNPINISAMRQQIRDIQYKIEKLAIIVTKSSIDSTKKELETKCDDLKLEQLEIMYKIDDCLNISIEQQLKSFVQEYMIYLCLEKMVGEDWKRRYETYDVFMDTNGEKEDKLVYMATYYFNELINKNE